MEIKGDNLETSTEGVEYTFDAENPEYQKVDEKEFAYIVNQTPNLRIFILEYGMDAFLERAKDLNEMACGKRNANLDLVLFHFVICDILETGLDEERRDEQISIMQKWFQAIFKLYSGTGCQAAECHDDDLQVKS